MATKNKSSDDVKTEHLFPVAGKGHKDAPEYRSLENLIMWPVGRIDLNPRNPRRTFDKEKVSNTAKSIKELRQSGRGIGGSGILVALEGRFQPGSLDENGHLTRDARIELTKGDTRRLAAIEAGLAPHDLLPIITTSESDREVVESALLEDIHRNAFDTLEFAAALHSYMVANNLSFEETARRMGQSKSWVQVRLDVYNAAPDAQKILQAGGSTTAVQRIDTMKEPKMRKSLIAAASRRVPWGQLQPYVTHYKAIVKAKGDKAESVRAQLIEGVKKDVPYDKLPIELRRAVVALKPGQEVRGHGRPSERNVAYMPGVDIAAHMESSISFLKTALKEYTRLKESKPHTNYVKKVKPLADEIALLADEWQRLTAENK